MAQEIKYFSDRVYDNEAREYKYKSLEKFIQSLWADGYKVVASFTTGSSGAYSSQDSFSYLIVVEKIEPPKP